MSDNGGAVSRIEQKFLSQNDLFGIKFNQGLVFLEVEGWEQTKYDPYSVGTVGPQSGSGFDRLEHEGDDILYVENDQQKVKHLAMGHRPASVRRYTNYPEDETRLRGLNNIGAPVPGDNFGFVDGEDSPYEAPTEAEELYVTPGEHLNFNFYNPDTEEHEVLVKMVIREYNINSLDPNDSSDIAAIRRVLQPGSPMPVVPAGSKDRQISYTLKKFWGVDAISEQRAERIKEGGN